MKSLLSGLLLAVLSISVYAQDASKQVNNAGAFGGVSMWVDSTNRDRSTVHGVISNATVNSVQDTPKVEIFGGYSYQRLEGTNFNGINGSVAFNPAKSFGVVTDYSLHFGPLDSTLQTLTLGPQFSYRAEKFTVFGRALLGGTRAGVLDTSVYAFAYGGGGGVDFRLKERVGVRPIQVDYLVNRSAGVNVGGVRLSTGFVFGN
jgi:hypothetical protein